MKRRRSRISASPVLVGAITVVIAVVAVFFSYNANKGLPFVPTPMLQTSGGILYAFDPAKGIAYLITLKKASYDIKP